LRAVYSVEIQRKSGTSFSTIDASDGSGRSERTGPGASSVTCTPDFRTSPRNDSLNVFTNAFVAAYVALYGIGELPAAEPEIKMPPALRSIMPGSTASTKSCTAMALSCTCAFSVAASSVETEPKFAVPALAHRIEMVRVANSSASFARSTGSARSAGRTSTATPYFAVRLLARLLRRSSRRAVMIRLWPRAANSVANASPMFCEAPVTTARASGLGAGTGMRQW
jgi:hypothetical protein